MKHSGVPASPSGCEPSASAAISVASSRSRIPNAGWPRRNFEQVLARITRKAIEESLAEIDRALEEKFGPAAAAGDWWNPDPEDPFWMIEVRQGFENAGAWVKNIHTCLTTRDPTKALRYPSRFAAEVAQRNLYPKDGQFEPTDHLWVYPASAGEAGTATTVQQGVVHKHAIGEAETPSPDRHTQESKQ